MGTAIKRKVYKRTSILTNEEFLNEIRLSTKDVSQIIRYDYFDAALDNFREYEYSLYEVQLN